MLGDCVVIDSLLAPGAMCFQRCVGSSGLVHANKTRTLTPSLAVVLAQIRAVTPWQRYRLTIANSQHLI